MMSDVVDPRIEKPGACRVSIERKDGNKWICINPVHDAMYKSKRGGYVPSNNPQVNYHYFVKKYPYREKVT